MSNEMLVITLNCVIEQQDWVYHELEKALGKTVEIFNDLDTTHSNEKMQQMLRNRELTPGVPCALLYSATGQELWDVTHLSFCIRVSSIVSAILQNVPTMIALHAGWDEKRDEFIHPEGVPFTIH